MDRAEIDMQVATAKKWPRQISTVKKDMMSFATLDEETAKGCFYKLPRGGKVIEGPSIRMAEIALSCYGNLRAATRVREIVTEGPNPHVVVQGACLDLEKNVSVVIEKRRRILAKNDYKNGGKKAVDEDDINLAVNSCSAIALRDATFKVVPLALIKPVVDAAKRTAIGDAKTLVERRGQMIDSFGKMGITPQRIFHALSKKGIDDIGLEEMETLAGFWTAIKENPEVIDECFPEPKIMTEKEPEKPSTEAQGATAAPVPPPAATTPPLAPVTVSAHERLAAVVTEAGYSFPDLVKFLVVSGNVATEDGLSTWENIHERVASRLLKNPKGLVDLIGRTVKS